MNSTFRCVVDVYEVDTFSSRSLVYPTRDEIKLVFAYYCLMASFKIFSGGFGVNFGA